MRLLLDENIASGLFRSLRAMEHHHVVQARDMGWAGSVNGELIAKAEEVGFDILVTADQRIRYQQNLATRRIGLIVLSTPMWPVQRQHLEQIKGVIDQAVPGCFLEIDLPLPPLKRRPPPGRPRMDPVEPAEQPPSYEKPPER